MSVFSFGLLRQAASGMALVFILGIGAAAATYLPITLKELTSRSKAIVEIKVIGSIVTAEGDPRGVRTLVDVEVVKSWKGDLRNRITIDTPGGTRGNRVYHVPDAPRFEPGEHAIVFIKEPEPGRYMVQDLGLGKFDVVERDGGRFAENSVCPCAYRGDHERGSSLLQRSIPYGVFGNLIKAYVAGLGCDDEACALAERLAPLEHRHEAPPVASTSSSEVHTTSHINWTWLSLAGVALLISVLLFVWSRRKPWRTGIRGASCLLLAVGALCAALADPPARAFSTFSSQWDLDGAIPNVVENGRIIWTPVNGSLSHPDVFSLVQRAFDQWENVPLSRIAFTRNTPGADQGVPFRPDSQNVMSWDASPSFDFSGNTLAVTFSIFDRRGMEESDVIFNDRDFTWSDDLVLTTALHEIGHQISLGHVNDPSAVMFPINQGLDSLSDDEILAVQTLYPDPVDPGGTAGGVSTQPTAAFTLTPTNGAIPLTVAFDAGQSFPASGSTILTYDWSFGDGASGTGVLTDHTYTATGTYSVNLTVRDDKGETDSVRRIVVAGDAATAEKGAFRVKFNSYEKDKFLLRLQAPELVGIQAPKGTGGPPVSSLLVVGGGYYFFSFDRESAKSIKEKTFALRVKDKTGQATVKISRTDVGSALAPFGAVDADVRDGIVEVPVTLSMPGMGIRLSALARFIYSAREGKVGKGKLK